MDRTGAACCTPAHRRGDLPWGEEGDACVALTHIDTRLGRAISPCVRHAHRPSPWQADLPVGTGDACVAPCPHRRDLPEDTYGRRPASHHPRTAPTAPRRSRLAAPLPRPRRHPPRRGAAGAGRRGQGGGGDHREAVVGLSGRRRAQRGPLRRHNGAVIGFDVPYGGPSHRSGDAHGTDGRISAGA